MSDGFRGISAADVSGDVPVRFWNDCLYERNVNLIAGPSGVGKSTATVKIAADLTRTGQNVIYCNAEDDQVMSMFRFKAAGADLTRIRLASYVLPADLDDLHYHIASVQAKLVVFDTAAKHLTGNSNQWIKPLAALAQVLQSTGCAALFVTHTNKSVGKSADWRAAIAGGAGDVVGTSRGVCLYGQRPDDPSQTVLCPVKAQYHEKAEAIAFEFAAEDLTQANGDTVEIAHVRIAEKNLKIPNPTALVVIQGDGDGTKGPSPEKAAEAAQFLTNALTNGPRSVKDIYRCLTNPNADKSPTDADFASRNCGHKSTTDIDKTGGTCPDCGGQMQQITGLETDAEAAGVSWGTVKKAKKALKCCTGRKGFGGGGVFFWRLPDGHPTLTNTDTDLA